MKTTQLLETVKKLRKVSMKGVYLPICDNVLNDNGTMTVTNLTTTYVVNTGFDGKFLINLKNLYDIASKLPKDSDVDISQQADNIVISLSGGGEFKLIADDPNDFPKIPEVKNRIGVLVDDDIKLIKKAVKYAANDELRLIMNGVFVGEHIVASDAHKLVYYRHTKQTKEEFVISTEVVGIMNNGYYGVCVSERLIELIGDNERIIFHKIDGKYPDYMNVISKESNYVYMVDKNELKKTVELASITANKASNLIRFKFNGDSLSINSADRDFCTWFEKTIPCEAVRTDNSGIEIGFKSTFLLEILSDSEDTVTMKMTDPSRGCLFDDDKLLMPMMIMR